MLLKRGAEAELRGVTWHGRPAVEKRRLPKAYRHPVLDGRLRASRLRAEARLLAEVRSLGIPVPLVYDIDLEEACLTMARVEGPTLKEILDGGIEGAGDLCQQLGRLVGRLHLADIAHGDLTTSNVIVEGGQLVLIDFGLGERGASLEAKGVDLHLLKEAFESAHAGHASLFSLVLEGYRATNPGAEEVLAKVRAIESRARYIRGS